MLRAAKVQVPRQAGASRLIHHTPIESLHVDLLRHRLTCLVSNLSVPVRLLRTRSMIPRNPWWWNSNCWWMFHAGPQRLLPADWLRRFHAHLHRVSE